MKFSKAVCLFGISTFILIACKSKKLAIDHSDFEFLVSKSSNIIINSEIDLNGKIYKLSALHIEFTENGKLLNGTLIGNQVKIKAPCSFIFDNVILEGSWQSDYGCIQWFQGDDFSNSYRNFMSLNQLISMQIKVHLDRMVRISTDNNKKGLNPSKNIIIEGKDNKTSGLILITKHSNHFHHYFQSDTGFNLKLDNLSIQTEDYLKGLRTNAEADYRFCGSYYQSQFNPTARPSIDSVIIRNCIINGSVGISHYGAHSDNQSLSDFSENSKIKKIEITGSSFNYCNAPFGFSNMGYESVLISENKIYNFSSAFISFPASGMDEKYYLPLEKNKGNVVFSKNHLKNDQIIKVPSGRAMSPFVIKGGFGNLDFTDNKLENLLSDVADAEVYTFYFTCENPGRAFVKNNTFLNVMGKFNANLIKQRSADKFILENNSFILEKEALVKVGIIRSVNADLSKLEGKDFVFEFMQVGGQTGLTKSFIIKNNVFRMPFVNKSTEIYDTAEFILENNTFDIEYFGPSNVKSSVSLDEVFFLGRQRLDRPETSEAKDFISKGNRIKIDKCGSEEFKYIYYPDGVQVGFGSVIDKNYNFNKVTMADTFYINNTAIGFSLLDGKYQENRSVLKGHKCSFFMFDHANANHLRPNAASFVSDIHFASSIKNSLNAPFVIIPESNQKISSESHNGEDILLLSYTYLNSLYNLANAEDLLCHIQVKYTTKNDQKGENVFYLVINNKSRSFQFEDKSSIFQTIDPARESRIPITLRNQSEQASNRDSQVEMKILPGDRHLRNAILKLTNTENIKSFQIECNFKSIGFEKKTPEILNSKIRSLKAAKQLPE
jgi:hypothetical protein